MGQKKIIKVLLVDDEPNILVALDYLMKQQGYQVEKAYNGQEALEKVASFLPDVMVLDVMMPGMDGFEVARQVRTHPGWEDIRIVFLTAKGTVEDRWKGYSNGGEVYLTKPFDNEELIQVINEVMAFG
jgi:DNA-binding response OmpR family regulator